MDNFEYAKSRLLKSNADLEKDVLDFHAQIYSNMLDLEIKKEQVRKKAESIIQKLEEELKREKSKCKHAYIEYENAAYESGWYCTVCGKKCNKSN